MSLLYLQSHNSNSGETPNYGYTLVQFMQCPAFIPACVGVCHAWRSDPSFAYVVCPGPVSGKGDDPICAPAPVGTAANFSYMIGE